MAEVRSANDNVTKWIYAASAAVILLFVASAFIVLDVSSNAANRFSLASEKKLVALEFQNQVEAAVQYQAQISFWNQTVEQLNTGGFSDKFVKDSITDWMWPDFNFSWMIFVDSQRNPVLSTRDGVAVGPAASRSAIALTSDLFDAAKERYAAALIPTSGGWRIDAVQNPLDAMTAPLPHIHVSDIRKIDGVMSIVVVQAVVPKSLVIPVVAKAPVFLVSVKPVTDKMLRNMELRLGIGDLRFDTAPRDAGDGTFVPVGSLSSGFPSTVFWTANAPRNFVWIDASPVVAGICLAAALAMIFIALRFARTVRALKESEEKNHFLARHDALTGLVNRAGLDEALRTAFARKASTSFSVMCIDLDRFKAVNDTYGHHAGDAVLKAVAARFAARVGKKGMVARMGGDEFVVLLDQNITREEAEAIANGIVIDAQVPIPFEGTLLSIGASAGVAFFPDHGSSQRALLAIADGALYAAKKAGRNRAMMAQENEQDAVAA